MESYRNECENKTRELDPIDFEITKDYKFFTWNGGDPIPLWASSDYRLGNEEHVEGFKIYHHKPYIQPFEIIRPIVEEDQQDKYIKKFIYNENNKRKILKNYNKDYEFLHDI